MCQTRLPFPLPRCCFQPNQRSRPLRSRPLRSRLRLVCRRLPALPALELALPPLAALPAPELELPEAPSVPPTLPAPASAALPPAGAPATIGGLPAAGAPPVPVDEPPLPEPGTGCSELEQAKLAPSASAPKSLAVRRRLVIQKRGVLVSPKVIVGKHSDAIAVQITTFRSPGSLGIFKWS